MFSQYSWWDFIKVVIALAIPYYAFVAWKYYREDIRDWFTNRGQDKPAPVVAEDDADEEPDNAELFPVRHYDPVPSTVPAATPSTRHEPKLQPGQWLPEATSSVAPPVTTPSRPTADEAATPVVELQGPAINDTSDGNFSMPVMLQAENPQEVSLDEMISAAGRISTDEDGVFEAIVVEDEPAKRVAAVLNNQQGRDAFSDFSFAR